MSKEETTAWLRKQSNSPYPIWALSALSFASIPLAAKNAPGVPSVMITLGLSSIFAGAGYVINTGDSENGSGISTAWCLSWLFLNGKTALKSMKPAPLALLGAVTANTVIYGKRTMEDRGFL